MKWNLLNCLVAGALLVIAAANAAGAPSGVIIAVEEEAMTCRQVEECVWADDFLRRSTKFRKSLDSALRESGTTIRFSIADAEGYRAIPVQINAQSVLVGRVCEHKTCPHYFTFIAYPHGKLVGTYMTDDGREQPIGNPTVLEIRIAGQQSWIIGRNYTMASTKALQLSQRSAPSQPASPPTVQGPTPSSIDIDKFHRFAALGSAPGRVFSVPAFITKNGTGMTMLCERTMGYGACESRLPMTRVEVDLNAAREAALYDARGNNGAAICALVRMQGGGGRPVLFDFRQGACPAVW